MNLAYAGAMGVALATGLIVSRRFPTEAPLRRGERIGLAIGALCGAMFTARLPFVLGAARDWTQADWFAPSGKTIVLGLVGGYLGVEVAKWALHIRTKTGDSFAVPVAASIAVGRLACFVGGCCYGTATILPWGVDFGDGVRRHPAQLYEAAFHFAAALILWRLYRRGALRRQLIKLYILAYLAYRFVSEEWRPEPEMWLGWTGYQWAAVVLAPLFAGLWWLDSRRAAAETNDTTSSTSGTRPKPILPSQPRVRRLS
ncbi:MAG: prolipoprotein diacylglyceryl transferase [Pirellulales bacterium]|nr:prolipoprotein diacylglyceryl transferase [Pirellulales bacterium]